MNLVDDRGYFGSVEYSKEDDLLHGRLVGLRDYISYEGTDVVSLKANFKQAIDDYLEGCEAIGKKAELPFKGSFNVRVGSDLHRRIVECALKRKISLNAFVAAACEEKLHSETGVD